MALTSLGLNERRTVGGREAMLRGAARRMERKGYSGGDFRQAAEMIRLERGSNIGSYEADVQENRTRAEMSKSLMAEGRKARGLSQEEPPDDGFTPEQRAAARGGFGEFEQKQEMARRNAPTMKEDAAFRGSAIDTSQPEIKPLGLLSTLEGDLSAIPDLGDSPFPRATTTPPPPRGQTRPSVVSQTQIGPAPQIDSGGRYEPADYAQGEKMEVQEASLPADPRKPWRRLDFTREERANMPVTRAEAKKIPRNERTYQERYAADNINFTPGEAVSAVSEISGIPSLLRVGKALRGNRGVLQTLRDLPERTNKWTDENLRKKLKR